LTPLDRLMRHVVKSDGCWIWTASKDRHGYGQFSMAERTGVGQTRSTRAHRAAYTLLVGPIPDGLMLDHLCDTRACVNPAHLEPVTNAENIAREYRRRRPTHCANGHAWTPENTRPSGVAGRACRRCHADRQNARYHAGRKEILDVA
jgi:hypothetical protein